MRLWFWLFLTMPLWAVVSIKPVDVGEKSGFSGEVSLAYTANRGNVKIDMFDTGVLLNYDTNRTASFLRSNYTYAEANDIRNIEKAFVHARHIRNIRHGFDWEGFAQEQTDAFLSLQSRLLLGTGARLSVGDPLLNGRGYLGLGIMRVQEKENLTPSIVFPRANIYLSYKLLPAPGVTVALEAYFQPHLENGADYIIASNSQVKVTLHEKLALLITLSYNVNSQPAAGIKPEEFGQKTALNYSF